MSGGPDACWPFTGKVNNRGRPYFACNGKKHLVYRFVYELVNGQGTLDGVIARHTCDNEICCNPKHIIPGTHVDNMNDMKERERHGLPHHTVKAIRNLGALGVTHKSIGDRFGIARSTVSEIISGVHYSHVKGDDNE